MADLSKIKLNGTEYNLKDAEARATIPTKINDLTDKIFGIAWLDNSTTNGYIYYNNVNFSRTGDSYYSSPFLFMVKNGTTRAGSVSLKGSRSYYFYNINTKMTNGLSTDGFAIVPNTEVLSYGVFYIGWLSDGTTILQPLTTYSNVNSLIASAIGNINSFEVAIVTTLPTENIDTHTIYFMANNNNAYDEYMYINNNWELIGSSNIDLSGYLQTTDIADWAKAATKPTYTASEVGALPDTTVIPDVTGKVNKSGDTMTGDLEFASQKNIILTNTNADSHKQITIKVSTRQVQGERTGCLEVNGSIASSSVPLFSSDLTNKQYVDDKTAVTNTLSTGTRIATINGTDILAPESGSSISEETDPVYSASPAASITTEKITAWDAKSDFSGSYNDLSDKPTIPTVPTNVSAFTNDSGYLTSFTETDPTVPTWAKAATKPTYTASEIEAVPVKVSGNHASYSQITNTASQITLTNSDGGSNLGKMTLNEQGVSFQFGSNTLISSSITNGTQIHSLITPTADEDAANKKYVDDSITTALSSITGFSVEVVQSLPATGEQGIFYFIPNSGSNNNIYDEYVYVNNAFEKIGTTEIDLSNYLQSSDIADWAKAETKPAYTAAEVGAMATTHDANAITSTDISNWNSKTSNTGTVTSVRVQATSPVQSSTNTAQTTTLNTTISLANGYGDTKNPYGTKTANYVLAGPTSGNAAVPGFRKLVAADIPAIGNITNAGDITTTATIASGDRLIINDESASKVTNSSITFGSSTTQYLANNGTWQNAYDDTALAARVTALENLEWATYYSGRSNPSNSQGQNGDIYLQY